MFYLTGCSQAVEENNIAEAKLNIQKVESKIKTGDLTEAVFDLKKFIEKDDRNWRYYVELARVQGLLKDYKSAYDTCNQGIKKIKNSEDLYLFRGSISGSNEILKSLENKNYILNLDSSYADLKKAKELAIKHNNSQIYKDAIAQEKELEKFARMRNQANSNSTVQQINIQQNNVQQIQQINFQQNNF